MVAVDDALDIFEAQFKVDHMQKRGKESLGPRSGGLVKSLTHTVKKSRDGVRGRVFFKGKPSDGDISYEGIARTHEFGAVIKGKNWIPKGFSSPQLIFTLEKPYHRSDKHGPWEWPGSKKTIVTPQVEIPARLKFFDSWKVFKPEAMKILRAKRDEVVKRFTNDKKGER